MVKKVLLVDMLEIFKIALNLIFRSEGTFELVAFANNKTEALISMEKSNPDLVILDITLEDAEGFDLCKDISKKYPKTKIVILTEIDDNKFRMNVKKSGASGYFIKSLDSDDFINSLKLIINEDNLKEQKINKYSIF